jgi:hypothetical protein
MELTRNFGFSFFRYSSGGANQNPAFFGVNLNLDRMLTSESQIRMNVSKSNPNYSAPKFTILPEIFLNLTFIYRTKPVEYNWKVFFFFFIALFLDGFRQPKKGKAFAECERVTLRTLDRIPGAE